MAYTDPDYSEDYAHETATRNLIIFSFILIFFLLLVVMISELDLQFDGLIENYIKNLT